MPSGGSCIALWDVVDYWYVSLHCGGDNAATGFWWSLGGIGGAVYNCVGKVRNCDCLTGRIPPGDGRPSARCGKVAILSLCLLANRTMCFYGVWGAGRIKGLKPEIVRWTGKLKQNPWTRELSPNPPDSLPSIGEIVTGCSASHQRSEKQYLTIPVKYL